MQFLKKNAPTFILAPMVGNSGLAYRILARKYGADICYSEMVHCKHFLATRADPITNRWYSVLPFLEISENENMDNFDIYSKNTFKNSNNSCIHNNSNNVLENILHEENDAFTKQISTSEPDKSCQKTTQCSCLENQTTSLNNTTCKTQNAVCENKAFETLLQKLESFLQRKNWSKTAEKFVKSTLVNIYEHSKNQYNLDLDFLELIQVYNFFSELTHPFVVQVCGNDPQTMLEACLKIQPYCEAVDINFGCPQNIAKKGFYGSFLQNDLNLTREIVQTLSSNLSVPVFCKIRIFKQLSDTLNYTQLLIDSGAKALAVHGRSREIKGTNTGLADLDVIKCIKENSEIPVFTNGNVICGEDVVNNLEYTKADGILVAESHLYDPTIFQFAQIKYGKNVRKNDDSIISFVKSNLTVNARAFVKKFMAKTGTNCFDIACEYLYLAKIFETSNAEIKSHIFKFLHHILHDDEREILNNKINIDSVLVYIDQLRKDKAAKNVDCSLKVRVRPHKDDRQESYNGG